MDSGGFLEALWVGCICQLGGQISREVSYMAGCMWLAQNCWLGFSSCDKFGNLRAKYETENEVRDLKAAYGLEST